MSLPLKKSPFKTTSVSCDSSLSQTLRSDMAHISPVMTHFLVADEATMSRIKLVLMNMEQKMELRGSAGEVLRGAVTVHIQNLAEAKFPCHEEEIIDLWKIIIGRCKYCTLVLVRGILWAFLPI